jgi:5-methylcytosine-specific restriction enzyme subunit McrC
VANDSHSFEFQELHESIILERNKFEYFLNLTWKEYKLFWSEENNGLTLDSKSKQSFFSFDGNKAKSRNFVGFMNYEDKFIEIYPKVFRNHNISKDLMHRHLIYWLSKCKKIKFPFSNTLLDTFESESFPELIIYLITKHIYETVNEQPYSTYEYVEEALYTPRGRINFNRYSNSLTYGRNHLIDCDYEPFVFDNLLNKVIKYCVRLLQSISKAPETQLLLNEIIFIFDEVEDVVCNVSHLNQVKIPSMFESYEVVIQSCRMILENHIYSYEDYDLRNWNLLLPMELIFEDFIASFIEDNFKNDYIVDRQKSELFLDEKHKVFNLQHDILIKNKSSKESIIVDTKYKIRDLKKDIKKQGVSQNDMYQMVSYAYRRGVSKVLMIYPNLSSVLLEDYTFYIQDGFTGNEIQIKVIEVPFWSENGYNHIDKLLFEKLNQSISSFI